MSFLKIMRSSFLFILFYPQFLFAEITILATTGMIKDAVANIGGSYVVVEALMGPGVDPHLYKATHGDMKKMRAAEIVFYNGLHLEGKMTDILEGLARTKPSVPLAGALKPDQLLYPEGSGGQADPHLWFDVALWAEALKTIPQTLAAHDPQHAAEYQQRYEEYKEKLLALHEIVKLKIATIPEDQRVLLTAHDAFGYFGRAYAIEVRGLQGISTASEFGLYDVKELVDLVLKRKIKAVFVETSVSKKFVTALLKGVEARGGSLRIGGELYSDAMGAAGTPEGTYTGMVQHNVETIVAALQ